MPQSPAETPHPRRAPKPQQLKRGLKPRNLRANAADVDKRIVALLDRIAGGGEARGILTRLSERGEPPAQIAAAIAQSAAFARLYKSAYVLGIGVEAVRAPFSKNSPPSPAPMSFCRRRRLLAASCDCAASCAPTALKRSCWSALVSACPNDSACPLRRARCSAHLQF